MAIRALRKKMKLITWVIAIAFFVTAGTGVITSVVRNMGSSNVAFKVNKHKVSLNEFNNMYLNFKAQLKNEQENLIAQGVEKEDLKELSKEQIGIITTWNLIQKKLTLDIAKDLKVSVSESEIEALFEGQKANYGEDFYRIIQQQGMTEFEYKKELEEALVQEKLQEKLYASVEVTEEELLNVYLETGMQTSLDEVRESLEQDVKLRKTPLVFLELLGEKLSKAKYGKTYKDEEMDVSEYLPEVSKVVDGIEVTNLDEAQIDLLATAQPIDKEKYLNGEVAFLNLVKEKGLNDEKIDNLSIEVKKSVYLEKLFDKIYSEVEVDEEALKDFYETNKANFLIQGEEQAQIKMALFFDNVPEEDTATESKTLETDLEAGAEKVKNKEVTYEELVKEFEGKKQLLANQEMIVSANGTIGPIGANKKIQEKIFAEEIGSIGVETINISGVEAVYIYEKIGHRDAREITYDDVKDIAEAAYRTQKARIELGTILQGLVANDSVESTKSTEDVSESNESKVTEDQAGSEAEKEVTTEGTEETENN